MTGLRSTSPLNEMPVVAADDLDIEQLVRDARAGDAAAADRLVRLHDGWVRSVLFGVVGRADAIDDLAQQVWTQAWARLDTLADPQRLKPWLYAIARHAAIDAGISSKRRSSRTQGSDALEGLPTRAAEADPQQRVLRSELHEKLMRAIQSLPALYREPFALRHLEDWTYAQIGELLGLPVDTVETRLVRARRLLRESLVGSI